MDVTVLRDRTYIAIDLKSFYASVECVERGLNPLNTNLVVADKSRSDNTICLAVSPPLKAQGVPGRPRLFEVIQRVDKINCRRKSRAGGNKFSGKSYFDDELKNNPFLELDYITAVPRMSIYINYSSKIYSIYLKYVAPEDIHVYSIDEVFIDATTYLITRKTGRHDFARLIIQDVLSETGITATCGIGTNLYLAKVAMDIVAKHMPADKDGVRIAELDEMSYREKLWSHTPITDFWRIGHGYERRLAEKEMYTMGDIARCSLGKAGDFYNEDLLYDMFGVNAELLIDHAWGYEPCTMREIKSYRSRSKSLSQGQVLPRTYSPENALLVVKEMAELLALDLTDKKLATDQIVLSVGYDYKSLLDPEIQKKYSADRAEDHYGRPVPKHAHGTFNFDRYTNSVRLIISAAEKIFEENVNPDLLIRRLNICACNVISENDAAKLAGFRQTSIYTDIETMRKNEENINSFMRKERRIQATMLDIKKKYGKNAILRGMSFEEDATERQRNMQIGGHKA